MSCDGCDALPSDWPSSLLLGEWLRDDERLWLWLWLRLRLRLSCAPLPPRWGE